MKSGIDYFPLDVSLDDKFELIEAEFGLTGFAVLIKLFQKIYGGQGYYCEWTAEVALLFCKRNQLDGAAVAKIVEAAVRRGIFDREMYEKHGILTSIGVQKRYFEAASRRKAVKVKAQYLLVPRAANFVFADRTPENADSTEENACTPPQRREEERKAEQSKGEDGAQGPAKATPAQQLFPLLLNDGSLYGFAAEQVEEWEALYPGVDVRQALRSMQAWCRANPSRRKTKSGILRFVTNWLASDQNTGRNRRARGPCRDSPCDADDFCKLIKEEDANGC